MPIMYRQDKHSPEEGRVQEVPSAEAARVRRKLISGGLSAAPVLMAAKSKSALAMHLCQSPSATMSGNLSHAGALTESPCAGSSPSTFAMLSNAIWTSGGLKSPTVQKWDAGSGSSGSWVDLTSGELSSLPGTTTVDGNWKWSGNAPNSGSLRIKPNGTAGLFYLGSLFADLIGNDSALKRLLPTRPTGSGDSNDKKPPEFNSARPVSIWEYLAYADITDNLQRFAQLCIVAYLNAKQANYVISQQQVNYMWFDIIVKGGKYCALDSCADGWDLAKALAYLESITPDL